VAAVKPDDAIPDVEQAVILAVGFEVIVVASVSAPTALTFTHKFFGISIFRFHFKLLYTDVNKLIYNASAF
jgi:hypothetical protein